MSRESKLAELRRKTDLDLIFLVQAELQRGLTLADAGMIKGSSSYAKAQRAHEMVKRWLQLISVLDKKGGQKLESELRDLGLALDGRRSKEVRRFAGASAD
jgi:hypothetical protein